MKVIAFVRFRSAAGARIYKEALALKKSGDYKLILIAKIDNRDMLEEVFDEIIDLRASNVHSVLDKKPVLAKKIVNILYRGLLKKAIKRAEAKKLTSIIRGLQVDLFHAITATDEVCKIVMENTHKPVIFDGFDFTGISRGIENLSESERNTERYCFEHASGIVHKGPAYEIDYYRNLGYKINCPTLQWLDYCNEDLFVSKIIPNKEIHLVYCGSISYSIKRPSAYYVLIGKILAKQKIHLHVYPSPGQWSQEYINLDKIEKYFHFHKPVPYKKLSQEIAKYDWGLWIHPKYNLARDPMISNDKRKVAIGNKLFTYLEAGLPIIVSKHLEYGTQFVKEHNIGFAIADSDLFNIKKFIQKNNSYNIIKAREELSLNKQAQRLDQFYKKILA